MLTHKNVMAAIISLQTFVRSENIDLGQSDVFLSFLPLAHIFDRWWPLPLPLPLPRYCGTPVPLYAAAPGTGCLLA